MTTYTDLTDDQRACWDAMVDECADCHATGTDEPCGAHDLGRLDAAALAAMVAAWRAA